MSNAQAIDLVDNEPAEERRALLSKLGEYEKDVISAQSELHLKGVQTDKYKEDLKILEFDIDRIRSRIRFGLQNIKTAAECLQESQVRLDDFKALHPELAFDQEKFGRSTSMSRSISKSQHDTPSTSDSKQSLFAEMKCQELDSEELSNAETPQSDSTKRKSLDTLEASAPTTSKMSQNVQKSMHQQSIQPWLSSQPPRSIEEAANSAVLSIDYTDNSYPDADGFCPGPIEDRSKNNTLSLHEVIAQIPGRAFAPPVNPIFLDRAAIQKVLKGRGKDQWPKPGMTNKFHSDFYEHHYACLDRRLYKHLPKNVGDAGAIEVLQRDVLHYGNTYPIFIREYRDTGSYRYFGEYKVAGYYELGLAEMDLEALAKQVVSHEWGKRILEKKNLVSETELKLKPKSANRKVMLAFQSDDPETKLRLMARLLQPVGYNMELYEKLKESQKMHDVSEKNGKRERTEDDFTPPKGERAADNGTPKKGPGRPKKIPKLHLQADGQEKSNGSENSGGNAQAATTQRKLLRAQMRPNYRDVGPDIKSDDEDDASPA